MVRLPSNDPSVVRKVLDTGVRTLVVPRVETGADVRRAAGAAFYTYEGDSGDRGIAHACGSSWGTDLDTDREDGSVLVGVSVTGIAARMYTVHPIRCGTLDLPRTILTYNLDEGVTIPSPIVVVLLVPEDPDDPVVAVDAGAEGGEVAGRSIPDVAIGHDRVDGRWNH